ncbi:hypothetical protein Hanom_Chr16g01446581 [Helianthus anomalus]
MENEFYNEFFDAFRTSKAPASTSNPNNMTSVISETLNVDNAYGTYQKPPKLILKITTGGRADSRIG